MKNNNEIRVKNAQLIFIMAYNITCIQKIWFFDPFSICIFFSDFIPKRLNLSYLRRQRRHYNK